MSASSRRSVLRLGGTLSLGLVATGLGGIARARLPAQRASAAPARLGLNDAGMIVAGPADASAGLWAQLLAGLLAGTLHPGTPLAVSAVGGRDGVTGANAFQALTNPDGATALLVPGAAAMAWLAGDPRVHFDAGNWVPALTSFGSAVVVVGNAPNAGPLRVAASTTSGVELTALLGLSLLDRNPSPVFGLADPRDARTALRDGRVDAILLHGRDVPARSAALCGDASKIRPLFSLGADANAALRDPALPDVPTLPELYRAGPGQTPTGPLFDAWRATAAAARLDTALVLPPLTPAALVALWRSACANAVATPQLSDATQAAALTPLPAPDCVAALSRIVIGENTLLALRRWLASRTDWRPA